MSTHPLFTQKHYEYVICRLRERLRPLPVGLVDALCEIFIGDNPKFKAEEFRMNLIRTQRSPVDVAWEEGQAAARDGEPGHNPYPHGRRAIAWEEGYRTERQRIQDDRDVDRDFHY